MAYRILYFYKKENACYREKGEVMLPFAEREPEGESGPILKVFYCGIPEYYEVRRSRGNFFPFFRRRVPAAKQTDVGEYRTPWNAGQLLRLMQNCCEHVSADACYLEEHFERELAQDRFPLAFGKTRMCGGLIRQMTGQFRGIDSILYLCGSPEEGAGELPVPEKLLRKLLYFFYLGEKSEQYAVLEENLWQQYGMPLLPVKGMAELAPCRIKRLLVLDDRLEGSVDWERLPRGCVYLDLWSDAVRREQIEKNRADIKYVSEYLYLCRNFDG